MRTLKLYPEVKVTPGRDWKTVKRCTVPNQSLSLREIVQRFVRRESLPISQVGLYEERFGDLEKLSKADIVERLDKVEELKTQIAAFQLREKERLAKKAEPVPPVQTNPGGGEPPVKVPPIGA